MKFTIDTTKLANQVKLCRRNLRSDRVKVCAQCPFEDIIVHRYPELQKLFVAKRRSVARKTHVSAAGTLVVETTQVHNCWNCGHTKNACFNKQFPPKKSSEGRDCHLWIPVGADDGQL